MYKQLQQQALLDIVEGKITQKSNQPITEYRLEFDNKVLESGGQMPEIEQAVQFLRGLLPEIHKRCTGDAQGHLFPTVDAAFTFAQNIERQLQLEKVKTGHVAVVSQKRPHEDESQSQQHKRGRGRSGPGFQRGRGGHEQYTDRYEQPPPPPRGPPHPRPPPPRGYRGRGRNPYYDSYGYDEPWDLPYHSHYEHDTSHFRGRGAGSSRGRGPGP